MPSVSDDALVIGLSPVKEADAVVRLLCRERGRRTAFARSARKSRKRFAGALQPFNQIQASLTVRRTQRLDRLDSAECVDGFMALREDLAKIYLASYYCDLLNALLVEGETYPGLFDMTLFFLHRLKQAEATVKHRLFFEIRLLDMLGYRPEADHCAECGKKLAGAAYFDPQRQAFLSADFGALSRDAFPVSESARLVLGQAAACELSDLAEVRITGADANTLLNITRNLIAAIVSRPLASAKLLDEELGL